MVKRPEPSDGGGTVTASQYEQEQLREWSTYRAVAAVDYYGVRAYNVGDPVPVSAVEGDGAWVFDDLVERVDGAQTYADSGTVVSPEQPTVDPASVAAPPVSSPTLPDAAPQGDEGSTTQEA
jgi:hypothetical protein